MDLTRTQFLSLHRTLHWRFLLIDSGQICARLCAELRGITMSTFLNRLVCAAAATLMIAGSGSVATVLIAPGSAFAKNDKSHGGGGGHSKSSERSHSDKSKADNRHGHGKSHKSGGRDHSKSSERSHSGKSKADNRYGHGKSHKKGHGKSYKKHDYVQDRDKHKKHKKYSSSHKHKKHKKYTSGNKHKKHNYFQKKRYYGHQGAKKHYRGHATVTRFGQEFGRDVRTLFGGQRKASKKGHRKYTSKSVAPIDRSPRPRSREYARRDGDDYSRRGRDGVRNDATSRDFVSRREVDPKLRGLNAAHANPKALRNAAPNSQVGRIAAYKDAAEDFYDLRNDLRTNVVELKKLDAGYEGRSSKEILDDVAALDPNDPGFDDALNDLTGELKPARSYEVAREDIAEDILETKSEIPDAARDAREAFLSASNGRVISPEAKSELHHLLGLPEPVAPKRDRPIAKPYDSTDASAALVLDD